ncbi:MAG: hypothetical protein K9H16_04475 [Bacteroidales bacterium]|nr:hypothetical protein [Bacteroidales bacterium]
MKIVQIHIGNEIKNVVEKKGISIKKFGDKINCNRTNVYDIFKRTSIDTQLLIMISHALEYNFFELFVPNQSTNGSRTKFVFEIEVSPDDLASFKLPDSICEKCSVMKNCIGINLKQIHE